MITYREATAEDTDSIAQLHTLSWQQTYRGAFSNEFLDGSVLANRQVVWQNRLRDPRPDQHVVMAESDAIICGFACAYLDENPVWGTLLDNLHVRREQKGQGIGSVLVQSVARWSYQQSPESGLYLWVLVQNDSARKFYDHMGGINQELATHENPDGSFSDCYRYVWPDVTNLL